MDNLKYQIEITLWECNKATLDNNFAIIILMCYIGKRLSGSP